MVEDLLVHDAAGEGVLNSADLVTCAVADLQGGATADAALEVEGLVHAEELGGLYVGGVRK